MGLLDRWPGDVLEFVGTAGSTLIADRLLRGEMGETLKKGLEDFKAGVEKRAEYRVVVRGYIEHELNDPYRAALQKIHTDARAANDLGRANRIEDVYVLIYLTFDDGALGNEEERKQMRQREFQDLGRAAMDPDPTKFDTMLEFYERRGLRMYLLIARQLGIDAWQFLGGPLTAIAEAIGGEGALEKVKSYIQDPKQWGPDWLSHRASVRGWAESKTVQMQEAYMWSVHDTAERPPDRWIRRVAIMIGTILLGTLVVGFLYWLTE